MMSLVKVLAALLVLGVLGATVTLVERLKKETAVPQLREIPEDLERVPAVEPGEIAFERGRELLATGQFEKAREKLEFLVGVYPSSSSAGEARRILGELNLDDLLSTDREGLIPEGLEEIWAPINAVRQELRA